ncbi:MAG: o-succinylbenzoate synthase [Anaerolineales bacterium]|nr:o-succinylbenzoate synthase [Anaerolineales bacterium]
MRISRVTLYHLRMPMQSAFKTSFGSTMERECILLEASSEGLVGYGECVADRDPGYSYETAGTAWHVLNDFLIPEILNTNLDSALELQKKIAHIRGHPMAKAGLEMVLWDLIGKRDGRSLQDLIGGVGDSVQVGVSVGIQEDQKTLVDVVEGYLRNGYERVKLKIMPGRDVEDVSAVRHAFPDLMLQVDANSAYDLESARALFPMDEMDLLLIEQPLAEDDLWDHRQLQKKFTTPICLDESIGSERHARQALEMKACKVINIKPGRVGGLSQGIAIHDLCYQASIPVWCGGMLETGIGRAANLAIASLPGFIFPGDISATERYYAEDITNEIFELNPGSSINVPNEPGLGVSVNSKALEKFTVRKITFS